MALDITKLPDGFHMLTDAEQKKLVEQVADDAVYRASVLVAQHYVQKDVTKIQKGLNGVRTRVEKLEGFRSWVRGGLASVVVVVGLVIAFFKKLTGG